MNLKSMETEVEETGLASESGRRPRYGYTLNIHLDEKQMKRLGLSEALPVGTVVNLEAKALVEGIRESVDHEGKEASMSLQITHMALEEAGSVPNPAEVLYTNS